MRRDLLLASGRLRLAVQNVLQDVIVNLDFLDCGDGTESLSIVHSLLSAKSSLETSSDGKIFCFFFQSVSVSLQGDVLRFHSLINR